MKLTRIRAVNFKGLSFDENLSALTIFVGANFAGKTARADAIRLLLLGYLPELGKAPRSTFGLASGAEMIVEGWFDNGQSIRRRFFLKGDAVKVDSDLPACLGGVGGPVYDMAVMLDASTYFALSDRARIDYVFGLVKLGDEWSPAQIGERLQKKFPAAGSLINALGSLPEFPHGTGQRFVEQAIELTTTLWKSAKDHGARMEQTIQGLSALRAADVLDGPSAATMEDRRGLIARDIAVLQEKKGRLISAFTQMKADAARREVIDREIRFADKDRGELLTLQDKLGLIVKEMTAIVVPANVNEMRETLAEASGMVARTEIHLDAAGRTVTGLKEELAAMITATACPCCGADGDGWKAKREAQLTADLAASELRLEDEKLKSANARAANRVALAALKEADALADRRAPLEQAMRVTETAIARLEPKIARVQALAEELARLMPHDPALESEVQGLQDEINIATDEARRLEVGIKTATARAGEIRRLAEAEKERDQAKTEKETAEAVGKELRALQGEMVEAAFKPLLATANGFYAGILRAPLAYHEGEIGMWVDGQWVAHHTFSGTEKALTYAAIQAALAAGAPIRVMVLDELGRVDIANVLALIRAASQAERAGKIDNFIGIDAGRNNIYQAAIMDEKASITLIEIGGAR